MFKKNIFLLLSGGILVLAILAIGANGFIVEAQAVPANAALSGWAWSSNIGWINFKSSGSGPTYGVSIVTDISGPNAGIKRLAGGAWSSTIGWIKFNPTAGPDGYPDDTASKKDAQFSGTNIIGWARACTVFQNSDCNGALKDSIYRGGWDGWLKMGGGGLLGGGVSLIGQQLTGYAWGGEVLGWVKFHDIWDGPGTCTGVCIDAGAFNVACTVSNPTPEIGEPVNFTVTTSGGVPSYLYNWEISNSDYNDIENTDQPNLTVTRSFDTPGTKVFSVNVTYGTYQQGKTGGANCAATVQVSNQNQHNLKVTVIGQGTIDGVTPPITNPGPTTVYNFSYDHGASVTLTGTVPPLGRFDWAQDCSGSNVSCTLIMDQDHDVTVTFTNPPQYCLAVRYNQGNRMTVNYQTQNLEVAHDSTRAVVEVRDNDPNSPNPVGGVPITLNINPLYTRADNEGQPRPEVKMTSSSVPVGGSTDVWIYFPTDGQPDSGFASPYSIPGNYVFALNQGSGIGPCNPGDPSPRINFTYIDVREREQ